MKKRTPRLVPFFSSLTSKHHQPFNSSFVLLLFCLFCHFNGTHSLCETETGENVAIVEIPESWGSQTNQSTFPKELPIKGSETEITLSVQSETHKYFAIKGKRLLLNKPLDRDEEGLTSIYLQVSCLDKNTSTKRSVPVLVKVIDINDHSPKFTSNAYETSVSELAPIGTTIFRDLVAKDADSGSNGLVEYFTIPGDGGLNDGYDYFGIKMPHQGLVTVNKPLDYEKAKLYYLRVRATDKATEPSKRFSATTTLTIKVEDGDDLDPTFVYKGCTAIKDMCLNPEYHAIITSGSIGGVVQLSPEPIRARDQDSLNASIRFTFAKGSPPFYQDHFQIDPISGTIRQSSPIDRSKAKMFELIVKAEQQSPRKRIATAKVKIDILAVDRNPPSLSPSSLHGFVHENAPLGTTVFGDKQGQEPLRISVSDADLGNEDTPAEYAFEVTTNAFRVNSNGYLVVNEASLDRDPPNPSTYTFQIIGRQKGSPAGKGASAPITLNVHLSDINDNAPKLPTFTPIRLQSGEGVRTVTTVIAKDADEVDKGRVVYSIHHVSNNGKDKFRVDPESGKIEAIGKLMSGEQYSLTVQATDSRNMFSQSILDVVVVPGPNAGGPIFMKERYEIEVSEGISPYSAVASVKAMDPEDDPIAYSIIAGNINEDFIVGSQTGTISVAKSLDREEVSSYNLVIKAQDRGGLYGTASVSIIVTDINDENPHFLQDKYLFRVDEGVSNAYVGKVSARDADIGENGEVLYAVSDTDNFQINSHSGEIFTRGGLDYERHKIHHFVVTAQDRAPGNSRLTTASVTVEVLDIQDELPFFEKSIYDVAVAENSANLKVVQVEALDPDTVPGITYVLREGDESLFAVDPNTGTVKTIRGLDYERRNTYTLVVGTLENNSNDPRATCVIHIAVQDHNDNPPIFHNIPLPIRLQDAVSLGTIVTTVSAYDADGTAPGNQIRYEIAGRDKSIYYFLIDSNNGVISVKDDLRKEPESEYRIVVKARDMEVPSLSATATVTVFVEHIATVPPDSGLGFADARYTVEVEENVMPNTLIKSISVINKPRGNFPMTCELISGNEANRFFITENELRDCEIRANDQLDYEKQSKYLLTVRLNAVGGVTGVSRLITQITVNVLDANDNKPEFIIPGRYSYLTGDRYIAAISNDAPADSQIIQLKAKDADSLSSGAITYELSSQSDPEGRFKIDPFTGILRSSRPNEDVLQSQLPLRVTVIARDNPELQSSSLYQTADVIINLIEDKHRIALVLRDTSTGRAQEMKEEVLQVLQERTGMIAGWEKAESLKYQRNNTIESDVAGTDVWFYLIEPGSLKILESEDLRIRSTVFETKAQNSLLDVVTNSLGFKADRIRHPYVPIIMQSSSIKPVPITTDVDDLGAALIFLASIIAIFGVIGIIYQCCMWSKFVSKRDRVRRYYVPSPQSRLYDPVYVEPSLKQYETQVLQMSVPIDEEGSFDGKISVRGLMPNANYVKRGRPKSESPGGTNTTTSSALKSSPNGSQATSGNGQVKRSRNPLFSEIPDDHSTPSSNESLHINLSRPSAIGKTTEL